jgi:hypothetical protein
MYTTEDGLTKIEATFDEDTVWLSLDQIATLFQRDKSTISRHIKNIFLEGELLKNSVVANFATTATDGKNIKKSDTEIAKNYLNEIELDALNKIVTAYLDIAEVRALNQEPMYMKDWLETIDDYLKMTRRDILTTQGKVSHKQAMDKAHIEYAKYKKKQDNLLTSVEKDFIKSINLLENIEKKIQ